MNTQIGSFPIHIGDLFLGKECKEASHTLYINTPRRNARLRELQDAYSQYSMWHYTQVYLFSIEYLIFLMLSTIVFSIIGPENAINKSNKGKSLVTLIFLSQSEVKKP